MWVLLPYPTCIAYLTYLPTILPYLHFITLVPGLALVNRPYLDTEGTLTDSRQDRPSKQIGVLQFLSLLCCALFVRASPFSLPHPPRPDRLPNLSPPPFTLLIISFVPYVDFLNSGTQALLLSLIPSLHPKIHSKGVLPPAHAHSITHARTHKSSPNPRFSSRAINQAKSISQSIFPKIISIHLSIFIHLVPPFPYPRPSIRNTTTTSKRPSLLSLSTLTVPATPLSSYPHTTPR